MTGPRRRLVVVAVLALAAAPAGAQTSDTETGNASATIVEPAQVTADTAINFGVLQAGSVTSVVRVTSSVPSTRTVISGDATLLLGAGGFGPAQFTVTGTPGQGFAIQVPTELTASHTGGAGALAIIAVNSNLPPFEGSNVFEGTIEAGGSTLVRVGGDLSVPTTAATGRYTSAFSISLFFQ